MMGLKNTIITTAKKNYRSRLKCFQRGPTSQFQKQNDSDEKKSLAWLELQFFLRPKINLILHLSDFSGDSYLLNPPIGSIIVGRKVLKTEGNKTKTNWGLFKSYQFKLRVLK